MAKKKLVRRKKRQKKTQCLKMQVIEKAEGNPDRVEVETSQLIFKVSDENQTELKHFITMFCFLTQVKQLKITPKYSLNKWTSPGHLHQRRGTGDDSYAHPWFFARGLKICSYTNICFPLFHYPITNPKKDNQNCLQIFIKYTGVI